MKKSLIALAVMAAAGAASAQSSVTLFGIVDVNYNYVKGDGNGHVSRLTDSGYNSSRLGFRGTEDLGGGLSASFWLEAGLNPDNGTGDTTNTNNQVSGTALSGVGGAQGITFNRRSTVSLSGGWGEVRIGRDYTPTFWNLTVFDPFGTNGSGTTATLQTGQGVNTVRASNSIGYFLPANIGGVYGQFQYAENELPNNQGSNIDTGRYLGGRVGFASGPVNVAVALGRTDVNDVAGNDNMMSLNVGGSWDFGFLKLMGQVVADRNLGGIDTNDGRGFLVGGLVPVGAGEIRLAYSQYRGDIAVLGGTVNPKLKKLAVGYVHNLSKRTALYTTVAHQKNSGGASFGLSGAVGAVNDSQTAVDLGIRHSF